MLEKGRKSKGKVTYLPDHSGATGTVVVEKVGRELEEESYHKYEEAHADYGKKELERQRCQWNGPPL